MSGLSVAYRALGFLGGMLVGAVPIVVIAAWRNEDSEVRGDHARILIGC